MHLRLSNHQHISPDAARKKARWPFLTFLLTCLLLVMTIVLLLAPTLAYASGTAPNGPGASSNWTPSNNTILDTAATTGATSDVWFTGYNGIIGEVFYPTADTANTTDLQFFIGDSGHTCRRRSACLLVLPRSIWPSITTTAPGITIMVRTTTSMYDLIVL